MDWGSIRQHNARRAHLKNRGRTIDPNSARQAILAAREQRRIERAARDASEFGCTWATSSRGGLRDNEAVDSCCLLGNCQSMYSALLVRRLREYYGSLDRDSRRAFLAQRTSLVPPPPGSRMQGKNVYETFLESPAILDSRLSQHGVCLPTPAPAELVPVCRRFLNFATGGTCFMIIGNSHLIYILLLCTQGTTTPPTSSALGHDWDPQ